MKRILALDLGGTTGWALQDPDGKVLTGVAKFLGTVETGRRWIRLHSWLKAFSDVELIVYEEPFVHFKHRSGIGISYGFRTVVEFYAAEIEVRCLGVAPRQLKAWATGNGNASKRQMALYARSSGWQMTDDNEIDARWLLEYARKRISKFGETAA